MKLPADVIRRTVEIAVDTTYFDPLGNLNDGDRYFELFDAYKIGAMALHPIIGEEPVFAVCHAVTGIRLCVCPDFNIALAAARAANAAIDWSGVVRVRGTNGVLIGAFDGMSEEMEMVVWSAIRPFDRVTHEGPPSVATFFERPLVAMSEEKLRAINEWRVALGLVPLDTFIIDDDLDFERTG